MPKDANRLPVDAAVVVARAEPVIAGLSELVQAFEGAGVDLYLVGGVVRDLAYRGWKHTDDIDLTTSARPKQIKALVSPLADELWGQGEKFGTIGASIGGFKVEITTFRAETYTSSSRKPHVNFGDSLEVDLSRRDFTINAMALRLEDRAFFDPFGGLSDLAARLLATPSSADLSFSDDPLRMLRAARFIPRFDLTAAPELVEAARRLADRLDIVSVERITDEIERLLAVPEPAPGLQFLVDQGLLAIAMKPFADVEASAQNQAVNLASATGSVRVRRAGLVWPLYRASGRETTARLLSDLRYPNTERAATLRLLDSLEVVGVEQASPASVRQLLVEWKAHLGWEDGQFVGSAAVMMQDLRQLATNISGNELGSGCSTSFWSQLEQLLAESVNLGYTPPLTGQEVMNLLDLSPGPEIGRALDCLKAHWVEHGPLTADEATRVLQREFTGPPFSS